MSPEGLDKAVKEEIERLGGCEAWRRKSLAEEGGIEAAAEASNTDQKPAVCRRV
jgi:hypothetical protein